MSWAQEIFDGLVGAGIGIAVVDHDADGSACSLAFKNTGVDLSEIFLLPGSDIRVFAALASMEFIVDLFFRDRKTCGASVDDDADRFAVGFSPRRDPKYRSKRVTCHTLTDYLGIFHHREHREAQRRAMNGGTADGAEGADDEIH